MFDTEIEEERERQITEAQAKFARMAAKYKVMYVEAEANRRNLVEAGFATNAAAQEAHIAELLADYIALERRSHERHNS
jgi:hypothetical protein